MGRCAEPVEHIIENYGYYGHCLTIDNGLITCVVSLEMGPRILKFSLNERESVFFE